MIKIEDTRVFGWEAAITGMRNPLNSWNKSDTNWNKYYSSGDINRCIGPNDLNLMKRLSMAGPDHGKYLRFINVTCDITAPLYWWKEQDQYKVGTVTNSCSTMHKIHSKPIELSDFSIDDFYIEDEGINLEDYFINVIADCESLRRKYLETKDKKYWRGLIQLLPSSYNQKRTVQFNYAVLKNMYHARRNHKLDCWIEFCEWIEGLPYAKELICCE